ncbi:MAG: hypothetical protein D6744_13230 [Planctomycetota bacterium]|nr:MAG: hypothetical protein D6744_13230 [Planctomycetota bacterium]
MWCKVSLFLAALSIAATPTFAQTAEDQPPRPPRATKIPDAGFWPTKVMIERFLDRIVDEMATVYEFDDEQVELTRAVFQERIPAWLSENRAEIQTLMNEFFEAQLDDEPPDVEQVAIWAQRVYPLIDEFEGVITETTDEMRDFLTEDQIAALEASMAAFHTGASLAKNKIRVWADGGFDPENEWIPPGREREERERAERERMRAEMEAARQEALAERGDPIAAQRLAESDAHDGDEPAESQPADEWTRYTLAFIERYRLNREQRQKAMQYLSVARESRDDYLRARGDELERVTQMLEAAADEPSRRAALEAYEKLNAPIERRFQQLKDRLDTLPTREQRRQAAQRQAQQNEAEPASAASQPATEPDGRP